MIIVCGRESQLINKCLNHVLGRLRVAEYDRYQVSVFGVVAVFQTLVLLYLKSSKGYSSFITV